MRVLVTAGGTREAIDDVRFISNISTGALGSAIAESFLAMDCNCDVVYLCGEGAITPAESSNLRVVRVSDVSSLIEMLRTIFDEGAVDGIVHAMAVSDYTVDKATSTERLMQRITDKTSGHAGFKETGKMSLTEWLRGLLHDDDARTKQSKISSDWEDLIVVMRKTPKVIALLRTLNPNAVLVGFKLLSGVSQEELLGAGRGILSRNQCDFVFANDLSEKTEASHNGFLIRADGASERVEGREQIAQMIAQRVKDEIIRRRKK